MLAEVEAVCRQARWKPSDRPNHQFSCECEMCRFYEPNLIKTFVRKRNAKVALKVREKLQGQPPSSLEDFIWVLKRCMLPSHKIVTRGVEFFTSEICFYKNGEPCCMFLPKDCSDFTLKEVPKQKLINTFLQKTFNERRRKYRELTMSATRSASNSLSTKRSNAMRSSHYTKQEMPKIDMSDAVVVRYTDGHQDLITENDFSLLINRRRQDGIWSTIEFIKNYIPVRRDQADWLTVKYDEKNVMYSTLKERAARLIRVYAKNIAAGDQQYISELDEKDFLDTLMQGDRIVLFTYVTYKLVEFIERFHDSKILGGSFVWKVDLLGHVVLEDVFKLSRRDETRFEWTQATMKNIAEKEDFKAFYSKTLPSLNPRQVEASHRLQEIMEGHYERAKERADLTMEVPENTEQQETNACFQKLHPECSVLLTEGLQGNMSVDDFRLRYLGERRIKRRPQQKFKLGLIDTIHKLTPIKPKQNMSTIHTQTLFQKFEYSKSAKKTVSPNSKGETMNTKCRTSTRASVRLTRKRQSSLAQYCF